MNSKSKGFFATYSCVLTYGLIGMWASKNILGETSWFARDDLLNGLCYFEEANRAFFKSYDRNRRNW